MAFLPPLLTSRPMRTPAFYPCSRTLCPVAWSWLLAMGLLLGLLSGLSAHASAAENPANNPAALAPPEPAPLARTYLPQPSETLDQVIARTLPASPLKIELLRQAYLAHNPQAIAPGKVPKLRKAMPLTVPDHEALLRQYLGSPAPLPEASTAPAPFTPSSSEERRRWVQFP